jgi:hypothetical protein
MTGAIWPAMNVTTAHTGALVKSFGWCAEQTKEDNCADQSQFFHDTLQRVIVESRVYHNPASL